MQALLSTQTERLATLEQEKNTLETARRQANLNPINLSTSLNAAAPPMDAYQERAKRLLFSNPYGLKKHHVIITIKRTGTKQRIDDRTRT